MLQNSHTFQAGAEPTETRKYTPRLPSKLNLAVVGIAAVVLAELFAPNQYKPSTLIGGFVGHEEAVDLRTKLEAAQATIAAQNQENARMQQEVELFRAHTERVTLAYKALYDRANILAQSMVGLQQKYLEMRQEVVTQLESGNKSAAVLGDLASIAGALMGNEEIANKAHAVAEYSRNQVMSKFDEETRRGTAQMSAVVDNWKVGIPDPAVMVAEERAAPIIPAPRSQPPMQSVVYRERQSASAVRLARVSNHFHNVFVRTEPRGGKKTDNKVCSLPQGAVVSLIADESGGRVSDPDNRITFTQVRFNWDGHGSTVGWVSEKGLEEVTGTTQDAVTPQTCDPV